MAGGGLGLTEYSPNAAPAAVIGVPRLSTPMNGNCGAASALRNCSLAVVTKARCDVLKQLLEEAL